jgi:hypothetical protein
MKRRGIEDDLYGVSHTFDEEGLFRKPQPFDYSTEKSDEITEVVANLIWKHQGRANAITIAELTRKTGKDARTIKGIVEDLVMTHGVLVGGVRQGTFDGGGYFIVTDLADLGAACGAYEAQIKTMQKRVDKLRDMARERGIG